MVVELRLEIDRVGLERMKKHLSEEFLSSILKTALTVITHDLLEDFELGVQTWEHKPSFQTEVKKIKGGARGEVFTTDEIYRYVSEGTPPHPIPSTGMSVRPMPVGPTGMPKTQPGRLYSDPGFRPPPEIFARSVSHPGIRARKFPEQIKRLRRKEIARRISEILGQKLRVAIKG